ncbi:AT rich interactive domain 5A (MRF1-like) [Actinomortierella wolfii]|nr:AT rich interactive domain 5A (MRF1-like) [Actinomortierella wolfii]
MSNTIGAPNASLLAGTDVHAANGIQNARSPRQPQQTLQQGQLFNQQQQPPQQPQVPQTHAPQHQTPPAAQQGGVSLQGQPGFAPAAAPAAAQPGVPGAPGMPGVPGTFGVPGATRPPITPQIRAQAALQVQNLVEKLQASRARSTIINDLTDEQKAQVKELMAQTMQLYTKVDQLLPLFFALNGNRELTSRLIFMKFVFQDQLEALKSDQYTISPENLLKLKEHMHRYFIWVRTEVGQTNPGVAMAQPGGAASQAPNSTLPQPGVTAAANQIMGNVLTTNGQVNPNSAAAVSSASTIAGSATTTTALGGSTTQGSPIPAGAAVDIKQGLTPADLKLPPPKKAAKNAPSPNSNFPGSPHSGSTPTSTVTTPNNPAQMATGTPVISAATVPAPTTTTVGGADAAASPKTTAQSAALPNAATEIGKGPDGANLTSAQLLSAHRARQQQQTLLRLQQQQQQQQQAQQLLQGAAGSAVQTSTPAASVATTAAAAATAAANPGAVTAGARPPGVVPTLETATKEELIQQVHAMQRVIAANALPANQILSLKLQLQRVQVELAKPHRQEQQPRFGAAVQQGINAAAAAITSAAAATGGDAATAAAVTGGTTPATQAATNPPAASLPAVASVGGVTTATANSITAATVATSTAAVEMTPQMKELQFIQQQHHKPVIPQLMEPLEYLASAYTNLTKLDSHLPQDPHIARGAQFMLNNVFEGFVGKRVGNGPGKDIYDLGPRAAKRQRTTGGGTGMQGTTTAKQSSYSDTMVAEELLSKDWGLADASISSFLDWAGEVSL